MQKEFVAISALGVAAIVGASALLTSPTACACLSSAQVVARSAGLTPDWEEAAELDPKIIERGLQAELVGHRPYPRQLFPSTEFGCKETTRETTECFVRTRDSWLIAKGWLVVLQHDPSGAVRNVTVSNSWRALPQLFVQAETASRLGFSGDVYHPADPLRGPA